MAGVKRACERLGHWVAAFCHHSFVKPTNIVLFLDDFSQFIQGFSNRVHTTPTKPPFPRHLWQFGLGIFE